MYTDKSFYLAQKMRFYFVTSDHLEDREWFRDEKDFRMGMNAVAVVSDKAAVHILAFVLMSNHVHFVLSAESEKDAVFFLHKLKRYHAAHLRRRYGEKEFLRKNGVHIQEVWVNDESLERSIAYTLMNPVVARLCASPQLYRWGSGACYYSTLPVYGTKLSSLSQRESDRILHSRQKMKRDLLISEDGMVLPQSFVLTTFVEKIYRSSSRFNYFLRNTASARQKKEFGLTQYAMFRDQIVRDAVPDICLTLFGKESFSQLDAGEKAQLAGELRKRFNADAKQIARVLEIKLAAAKVIVP